MNVIHDGETVRHSCINCGHGFESAVINAPIAFEADTGGCDGWCIYVTVLDGGWLVDPEMVRNRVRMDD